MTRKRQIFITLGLALATGIAVPACMGTGSGYIGVSTTPVVYQEPPAPQVESVVVRPGHVWVKGRWDWQNGQWAWIGGRWEAERSGYAYSEGRWERRGNSWHWVDGQWSASSYGDGGGSVDTSDASGGTLVTDSGGYGGNTVVTGGGGARVDVSNASGGVVVSGGGSMYPTVAPPPLRTENYGAPRDGFVWVSGRWNWSAGQWAWADGHWERQRANQFWVPGRWELQGNYYVWVDGRWDAQARSAPGPEVRDHRH